EVPRRGGGDGIGYPPCLGRDGLGYPPCLGRDGIGYPPCLGRDGISYPPCLDKVETIVPSPQSAGADSSPYS
ncbi:MAG: hypothetical protein J6R33_00140, partial [Clostridia bacterium]|nr:hypothetical protein [Clostridia bacterium]